MFIDDECKEKLSILLNTFNKIKLRLSDEKNSLPYLEPRLANKIREIKFADSDLESLTDKGVIKSLTNITHIEIEGVVSLID